MNRTTSFGAALLLALLPAVVQAQGLLIVIDPHEHVRLPRPVVIHPTPRPAPPAPPMSYKIKELSVQAKVTDQVARVQVSQSFVNTGSRQMEVSFVFPLPYDGAIDQLTLMVDGKEFPAKLLDARIRLCWNGSARACFRPAYFRCLPARSARSPCATINCCAKTTN